MGKEKKEVIVNWELTNRENYVILDIETTGFSPVKMDTIIEIGAIKVKNGEIVDTFSTFINPHKKLKKEIEEVTGITNEDLTNAPNIDKVLVEFRKFIANYLIIAHNASFDWDRFLMHYFPTICIHPNNDVLDTMNLSKLAFPNEKKHNLKECCDRLNIPVEGHHRALNDAKMTFKVYKELLKLLKDNIPSKENNNNFKEELEPLEFDGSVVRVSTWIVKTVKTQKVTKSRQYITLRCNGVYGEVYFDNITRVWCNKNFSKDIDITKVEEATLKFLRLNSIDELASYNSKA